MDIGVILQLLSTKFPLLALVFGILGALVVLGQVIVVMTPSKADDAAWDRLNAIPVVGALLTALIAFAPIQKK